MIRLTSFPISTKFLFLAIITVAFFGFATNNAFGASGIVSTVANDPDDGDTIYSIGDTITITFPAATNATGGGTMTNAEIIANFTWTTADVDSDTLTGTWDGTSTILTILVNAIGGVDPPIPNTDTINYQVGTGKLGYGSNNTEFTAAAVTLTGDFGIVSSGGGGGDGCDGECNASTLGVNSAGNRLVDNGFSYNGKAVDVESFYTSYPLVTGQINRDNTATFKIYEDQGPQNIRHIALAFGLGNGQVFSNSKAVIEWDRSWDGKVTVTEIDPENALKDISVETSTGPCRSDSIFSECLIVTMHHSFSKALDFNMISTNVWDSKRNSWQNYYNHGIQVEDPDAYPYVKTSYEKPIMVEPLCIGEDATHRDTCAFEKVKDWSTQNAEDTLNDILNGNYVWK